MLGFDPELGASALRLWVAAGSAAVLVAVLVFYKLRSTSSDSGMRSGVVVLGAILGASLAWALLDPAERDHAADRRALDIRAQELTARTLAPGSALACLDATAGESIGAACERAIFATPAAAAAAISYVAARFKLLSDMVAYGDRSSADMDAVVAPLRRSLEADRFGFLAHALAAGSGCTSQDCKALAVLRDASHVRVNLIEATLDRYLERYATMWAQVPEAPVADATSVSPSAMTMAQPGQRKVSVNIDFPTAASIPPVSIMNPEPKGPGSSGGAAAPTASANAQAAAAPAARRSRKQGANTSPQAGPQSAPPAPATGDAQVDPVWTPAPSAAAPQPAAPAANFASGVGAPVQLNPFPAPPNASANVTTRTQ